MPLDQLWPARSHSLLTPHTFFEGDVISSPGPSKMLRRPFKVGLFVIAMFVLFFVGWGAVAPLSGGAIASAHVTPEGGIRTVQHLEGGIIRKLHVREGDRVGQGDPLVTLANATAEADMQVLRQRRNALLAEQRRLEVETTGRNELVFSDELAAEDPILIQAQRKVFDTRRAMVRARKNIFFRRIDQLYEQIAGYRAQADSASEQMALLNEEISDKTRLLTGGLARKGELLQLQRMLSGLGGDLGEYRAEIARADEQIGEARLELLSIDVQHAAENAVRIAEISKELDEVERMLEAKSDVLQRAVIPAPVAGTVAKIRIVTTGGVVSPGEPILDIVPQNDQLFVDAMIQPIDIDLLEIGTAAKVTLTAYAGNTAPPISGRVVSISANTMREEVSNRDYYLARVAISESILENADLNLVPGMTAEVMFVTAERTFLAYLLEPLTRVVRRGLREDQ